MTWHDDPVIHSKMSNAIVELAIDLKSNCRMEKALNAIMDATVQYSDNPKILNYIQVLCTAATVGEQVRNTSFEDVMTMINEISSKAKGNHA